MLQINIVNKILQITLVTPSDDLSFFISMLMKIQRTNLSQKHITLLKSNITLPLCTNMILETNRKFDNTTKAIDWKTTIIISFSLGKSKDSPSSELWAFPPLLNNKKFGANSTDSARDLTMMVTYLLLIINTTIQKDQTELGFILFNLAEICESLTIRNNHQNLAKLIYQFCAITHEKWKNTWHALPDWIILFSIAKKLLKLE